MGKADAGLRDHLVAVGVDLVSSEGTAAVSLREIARRAGVSHGAPRRYFPTHLALLSAIARTGFADLGARVGEVVGQGGTPRAQLLALGRLYLDFAQSRRGMFELMFRHDLLESGHLELREASLPLFDLLVDLVTRARAAADATGADRPEVPSRVVAGALWANLHGIAQLWGWGSLQLATGLTGAGAAGEADAEPLLRAALDAHLGAEPR